MSQPQREIELKFLLGRESIGPVLAALPAGETREKVLEAVYYDTADRWLGRHGFGLRVRRSGEAFIQTLKSAPGPDGGRGEWEWPVASAAVEPALLETTPAALPDGLALVPCFSVLTRRAIRDIAIGGAEIELALDEGEVVAGDRREPFLELELELRAGPPAALFDLARELSAAAPLTLSHVTKAERGFALAEGRAGERPRLVPPALTDDLTAGEAFQLLAMANLAHLGATAASLRERPGPEGVHQLRVAVRRLRALMTSFRPVIDDSQRRLARQRLKTLARELDEARDLDVFIADFWRPAARERHDRPGMAGFGRALHSARDAAYDRALSAVGSAAFRALMLETAAWLQCGPWTTDEALADVRDGAAADFAARALKRGRRRLLKRGERLGELDRAGRHQLRIEGKILRYAVEDLRGLFPRHPRRADRFVEALKALQDDLGALNDLAFSEALARAVAAGAGEAEAAFAAGELAGGRARDEAALVRAAEKAFRRFAKAERFW